jgi:hypothetical protein
MLAEVQFQLHDYDALLPELADVKNWMGRIDEKAAACLILCDVHIQHRAWDTALECLHRLDGSGLLATTGRLEITKRLQEISEQRTYESKMQAVHALEKSLGEQPKKP